MSITAEAAIDVDAPARAVLEFVLDLDRYRQADRKIVRVGRTTGPDVAGRGSVKLWGRMRGTPPLPDLQLFELDRWRSITFTGAPGQPGRLVFAFTGTFTCESTTTGCRVVHAYEFAFRGPFRHMERFLGGWLQAGIEQEVLDVKRLVEADRA